MKITPFGEFVRLERVKARLHLKDMAAATGYSEAYLSAVETGRKALNDEILNKTRAYFVSKKIPFDDQELLKASDMTRTSLCLKNHKPEARAAIARFARELEENPGQ